MALPKHPPAFERSSSSASRANYGSVAAHPQPYLVMANHRRPAKTEGRYLPLFPHESEDACLTGSTRSLYRRVLGLNVTGTVTHLQVLSSSNFVSPKIA
jgi:hypothetical protein